MIEMAGWVATNWLFCENEVVTTDGQIGIEFVKFVPIEDDWHNF